MKKQNLPSLFLSIGLFICFTLWTVLVKFIDVQPIGANGSEVGFATLNAFVKNAVGVRLSLYVITDWLGIVPILVALCFAIFGLFQWIQRKNILKVDFDILALGVYYIIVIAIYIFFEITVINYRPILINGYLEASYPSSTTTLVLCVMPTALIQSYARVKNKTLKYAVIFLTVAISLFMLIGRILSGVHWITDIIGGILISLSLVLAYYSVIKRKLIDLYGNF